MSYDLTLFRVPEGMSAESVYERLIQEEEDEVVNLDQSSKQPPPESVLTQMQRIADALRLRWPGFVQFQPHSPLSWIELDEEGLQVQVNIRETTVAITIPYFRPRATEMMDCVRCCMEVLAAVVGYVAYDPQLGRVVAAEDIDEMVSRYRSMDRTLPEMVSSAGKAAAQRPWWKLW